MSPRSRALAQPQGDERAEPGTKQTGDYYRIIVRPKEQFVTFRNQDVGESGGLQRLAGKRQSGSWATHAWLINKKDAHVEGEILIPDDKDVKELLNTLRGPIKHQRGDIFTAKDRLNIPEERKPTAAQKRARSENIKKAQSARHSDSQENHE